MKNLKKMSRENLRSISGGAPTVPILMCPPLTSQVRCFDPYNGAVTWQCTRNGDSMLCLRLVEL